MKETQLNVPIGNRDLSAWQPVKGITWIQSRSPKYSKKLAERQDSRLVATGVSGGYLRTYEFIHPLSWAQRLINRYTSKVPATNERSGTDVSP